MPTKWEGQLTLADFLSIEKPANTIKIKAYVPSAATPTIDVWLQGETEEVKPEDLKDWKKKGDEIKQKFLDAFHWAGNYKDNKLNRRLNRVGLPKNLERLVELTNDEQLSAVEKTLEIQPEERRSMILSKALEMSGNVDELVTNTSTSAKDVESMVMEITEAWMPPPFEVETEVEGVFRPVEYEELVSLRDRIKPIAELRKKHPELVPKKPSVTATPEDVLGVAKFTQRKQLVFKPYLLSLGYTDAEIVTLREKWGIRGRS